MNDRYADATDVFKKAKLKVRIDELYASFEEVERLTYSESVVRFYHDYEATVFWLAEQSKSETIESIKRMSVGQRMKFSQLIKKRNKPNPNGGEKL